MAHTYVHHRLTTSPRRWRSVAERLADNVALYGIWRSQIGRPRDELSAITIWPDGTGAAAAEAALLADRTDVLAAVSETMAPTLRPARSDPPTRQGNYAFRWFVTPEADWPEFLDLCAAAWPGFEAAYDSQVIGLWRLSGERAGGGVDEASGSASGGRAQPAADPAPRPRHVGTLETAARRRRGGGARYAQPPLRPVHLDRGAHHHAADRRRS